MLPADESPLWAGMSALGGGTPRHQKRVGAGGQPLPFAALERLAT